MPTFCTHFAHKRAINCKKVGKKGEKPPKSRQKPHFIKQTNRYKSMIYSDLSKIAVYP